MNKHQLLSLVQEIEQELSQANIKHPDLLQRINLNLIECKHKITQHHHDIIDEIDDFVELLDGCNVDNVIELDELFDLIDQIHDILTHIKTQINSHRDISRSLLLETKGLLESVKH